MKCYSFYDNTKLPWQLDSAIFYRFLETYRRLSNSRQKILEVGKEKSDKSVFFQISFQAMAKSEV